MTATPVEPAAKLVAYFPASRLGLLALPATNHSLRAGRAAGQ